MQDDTQDVPNPILIFLGLPLVSTIHGKMKFSKTWKRFGRKRIFVPPPRNIALFFENDTFVFAHVPSWSAAEIKKVLARTVGPVDVEFYATTEMNEDVMQQTLATVIRKLKSMNDTLSSPGAKNREKEEAS